MEDKMDDKLVTVAAFNSPIEADLAKNRLEAEGIRAWLSDEVSVGWVWGFGNALGGVKVQVAEKDAERALAVLEAEAPEVDTSEPDAPADAIQAAWTCSRCGTEVNPAETVCPGCGTPAEDFNEFAPSPELKEVPGEGASEDEENDFLPPTADDLAARALKAAVLGLLACPPLLHIYSAYLLLQLAFLPSDLGPRGIRNIVIALMIDCLVFLGTCLFILGVISEAG